MKKILFKVAILICVIAFIASSGIVCVFVYANQNIDYKLDEELFLKASEDRTIYYYAINSDGNASEIYKSSLGEKREWTRLSDCSEYLKKGFIAMEDREFYSHHGVNVKRTVAAAINCIFKINKTFGASTITQQVIKNISGDNEFTISRKFNEILRALNLEKKHSKDDILELYLNIIPMSSNIYGVGAASEILFDKKASDISLAEAATLIGITNAPSKYNPRTYPSECVDKRNKVLYAMLDEEYITADEYNKAINEPLILNDRAEMFGTASWFVETANEEIYADLYSEYGLSKQAARIMLNGARIILTVNPVIQEIMEDYFSDLYNFPQNFSEGLNYSMVVSDPFTGDLLGVVGNIGKKKGDLLLNYATSLMTPASAIKPIALYAPLIESGEISWASIFEDDPISYNKGGGEPILYPKNSPEIYEGAIDINTALKKSKNTVAVRLYNILGSEKIYSSLKNEYGFDSLVWREKAGNGNYISDLGPSPLALGQLTKGVSIRKLTESYGVFVNDGNLCEGRSYSVIYDAKGDVLLKKEIRKKALYSIETAQVMNQLLSNVVTDGTARQINLDELVDVAGKTGTSGGDLDRVFVGYTPYYSAGIWCGYADGVRSVGYNTPSHLEIWDEVMRLIHNRMILSSYNEEERTFDTDSLIIAPYCSKSGLCPGEGCQFDDEAEIRFGYFSKKNIPNIECHIH